jgi:hypothetical protein
MCWFEAAARPEFIPLKAVKLDTGWRFECCLDGEHWHEGVLKSEQNIADDKYALLRNGALKRIQERKDSIYAAVLEMIRSLGVHEVRKHIITKDPVLPSELPTPPVGESGAPTARPSNAAAQSANTANTIRGKSQGRVRSSRRAAATRSVTSQPTNNWDDLPDMDEIFSQVDQAMKGDSGNG